MSANGTKQTPSESRRSKQLALGHCGMALTCSSATKRYEGANRAASMRSGCSASPMRKRWWPIVGGLEEPEALPDRSGQHEGIAVDFQGWGGFGSRSSSQPGVTSLRSPGDTLKFHAFASRHAFAPHLRANLIQIFVMGSASSGTWNQQGP